MSILSVEKAIIAVGITELDAYTANEISSTTGAPINYLSGAGLAESIGLSDTTTLQKRLSKELKELLGKEFTTLPGKYKNESGAYSKINLWDTVSAATYYLYHALQGNEQAKRITIALTSTTLDIIINDKFKRQYEQGQAEAWTKARASSKEAFWELGDAVTLYKEAHPERSDKFRAFVFSNCQDCLNRGLFGKAAATIREELGVKTTVLLRDHYGQKALRRLNLIQSLAAANIINQDIDPLQSVKDALATYRFHATSYKD